MSERLQGVRDLVGKHGWWLLDQYGVLHDGKRPYNGAVEAVKGLNESGESMVIISNSSRRASHAEARLDEMGFKREWFQGFVTSGEMAHNLVMNREFPVPEKASKVVHLTWSARGAAGVDFDALGLEPSQPEEADFVLAHGCEALDTGGGPVEMDLDSLSALALSPCAQRNLPMVVANPDMETVTGDGHKFPMPGVLAKRYEQMGGYAHRLGKPEMGIYQLCASVAGKPLESALACGDSAEHDVAGGQATGIATAFVLAGIHRDELGDEPSQPDVDSLCRRQGAHGGPTYILPSFVW